MRSRTLQVGHFKRAWVTKTGETAITSRSRERNHKLTFQNHCARVCRELFKMSKNRPEAIIPEVCSALVDYETSTSTYIVGENRSRGFQTTTGTIGEDRYGQTTAEAGRFYGPFCGDKITRWITAYEKKDDFCACYVAIPGNVMSNCMDMEGKRPTRENMERVREVGNNNLERNAGNYGSGHARISLSHRAGIGRQGVRNQNIERRVTDGEALSKSLHILVSKRHLLREPRSDAPWARVLNTIEGGRDVALFTARCRGRSVVGAEVKGCIGFLWQTSFQAAACDCSNI